MNEEKLDPVEKQDKDANADIVIDNKLFKWIENFWFYHKWHLLIVLAAILLLFVVIDQISIREKDDIVIMCAGPYKPSATQNVSIRGAFAQVLPSDFNEDGERVVSTSHTEVYSKEQIIEYQEQYKAEHGESALINSSLNAENLKGFHNLIMAGEYSVCIIDMWLYEDVKEAGGFRPLAEIFPEGVPESAIDEYAVKFKETSFAKSFSCFDNFPDSTVICLRTKSVMGSMFGSSSAEKKYSQAEEMFKAILNFVPAE